ncbi:MAG: putative C-S lyase [Clostridia bacterium]|nr:putative C-S lyase [Clostridia bacterium]
MKYNFDEIISREGTNCIKYDALQRVFGSEEVLPMWVADMDFRTPDFVIDALRKRLEHEILGYTFRGNEFNEAIVSWMKKRHGWDVDPAWLCFSPGVVPALNMLVMALTEPTDRIIVQPPVYFPFFGAIRENGREIIENPLVLKNGRLCMDLDDLKQKAVGARMLLLCHPHNPGGSVWTRHELETMAQICIDNDVLIVSDEIHSDLIFDGHRHIPLASLSPEVAALTVTCNAPSKTFNLAGLATSYLIIPNKDLLDKYNHMINDQLHAGMGNLFGAIALQAAYAHGEGWLEQLLEYVHQNVKFVGEYLQKNIPQITMIEPESTYMIWLDCRSLGFSTGELKDFFINNAHLGLNEGAMFGTGGEGFMRLNVACPHQMVQWAMEQLRAAVDGLRE